MLPFEFLELVDGLSRLDPVGTYAARAGQLMARLCGAEGYVVKLEEGETISGGNVEEGRTRITLALRHGRQVLGEAVLVLPAGKEHVDARDLRATRWAARIVGRSLSYSARIRGETSSGGLYDVSEALHKAPLTPRERDVVGLLVSGASTRQIASETQLSVGTIHTYLKRIYPKMGVRSRVELVARVVGTQRSRTRRERPMVREAAAELAH